MSTNSYLKIGTISALVVRKPIKNLHLAVLPPDGRVRVTAPNHMKDEAILTLISTRLPWIKRQQIKFAGQERQTRREYINGESHYFLGRRYRLELAYKDTAPAVFLRGNNKIVLQVRPKSPVAKRHEVMMGWYRKELFRISKELISKWQEKMDMRADFYGIKRMKTRWGTCNTQARRIWLNLELAKKPIECIEYVVVHEMVHLLERSHNKRFIAHMDKLSPKWKHHREELNRSVLGHVDWSY